VGLTWTLAAAGLLAGQTGNYGPAPYSLTTAGPNVVAQAPASGVGRFFPWRRSSANPAPAPEPQVEDDRPFYQRIGDRVGKMFNRSEEPTPRPNGTFGNRGTVIIDDGKSFPGSTTAEPPLGLPTTAPSSTPLPPLSPSPPQRLPVGPSGGSAPVQSPAPGPFKLSGHSDAGSSDNLIPSFKSATVPASSPATVPTAKIPTSAAELAARPNRITPSLADKVGRDDKFEWITGQLRQENGRWVIWYATPEVIDPYEGHLPLLTDADLSKFHDGDLVSVHGSVVTQGRSPAYRTTRVDLIPQGR